MFLKPAERAAECEHSFRVKMWVMTRLYAIGGLRRLKAKSVRREIPKNLVYTAVIMSSGPLEVLIPLVPGPWEALVLQPI